MSFKSGFESRERKSRSLIQRRWQCSPAMAHARKKLWNVYKFHLNFLWKNTQLCLVSCIFRSYIPTNRKLRVFPHILLCV